MAGSMTSNTAHVAAYDDTQHEFVSIEERYAALIEASAKAAATA